MSFKPIYKIFFFSLLTAISFNTSAEPQSPPKPVIKAGAVALARLDTPVSSENLNKMVTATIIDGKFTGVKLMGKLKINKIKQQKTLVFDTIYFPQKKQMLKAIHAFGIDFDDARVAMVTGQGYDDLKPNSKRMASAFLDTYTNAAKIKLGAGNDLGILFLSNVG